MAKILQSHVLSEDETWFVWRELEQASGIPTPFLLAVEKLWQEELRRQMEDKGMYSREPDITTYRQNIMSRWKDELKAQEQASGTSAKSSGSEILL